MVKSLTIVFTTFQIIHLRCSPGSNSEATILSEQSVLVHLQTFLQLTAPNECIISNRMKKQISLYKDKLGLPLVLIKWPKGLWVIIATLSLLRLKDTICYLSQLDSVLVMQINCAAAVRHHHQQPCKQR